MNKSTKEHLVTVATGQGGKTLTVALVPNSTNHDGYVIDGSTMKPVFVYTAYMQHADGHSEVKWKMILNTKFHRQFWDAQDSEDTMEHKDWARTFVDRELPFSEESLKSIGLSQKEIYGHSKKSND